MAYFLESHENSSFQTSFIEDYTGMNEILFNAEVAWGNIMESAMMSEYKAIRNEDYNLLEETKDGFFEKVKQWFKDLFAAISRVINNIKNTIVFKMVNYSKWARKVKKDLKKDANKKFDFYCDYLNLSTEIDRVAGELQSENKEVSRYDGVDKDKLKDTFKEQRKELEKKYNNIMEKIKQKNSTEYQTNAANVVSKVEGCLTYLESNYKKDIQDNLNSFENARKACKNGISMADKKEEKEKITKQKLLSSYLNVLSSRYFNLKMKNISLMVSFIKKFVTASKK